MYRRLLFLSLLGLFQTEALAKKCKPEVNEFNGDRVFRVGKAQTNLRILGEAPFGIRFQMQAFVPGARAEPVPAGDELDLLFKDGNILSLKVVETAKPTLNPFATAFLLEVGVDPEQVATLAVSPLVKIRSASLYPDGIDFDGGKLLQQAAKCVLDAGGR